MEMKKPTKKSLDDLFPEPGRVLLTGGGKQFVERIGIEAIRHAVHSVMMGENLRTADRTVIKKTHSSNQWSSRSAIYARLP